MIKEWNVENYECKIDHCKKQKKQQYTVMGKLVKLASRSGESFLHTQESISFSLTIGQYETSNCINFLLFLVFILRSAVDELKLVF